MRFTLILFLITAFGCQRDVLTTQSTLNSETESPAAPDESVDSNPSLSVAVPRMQVDEQDAASKYGLTDSEAAFMDISKDLFAARNGSEKFDEEAWVARMRRRPTTAEWNELAIDLGMRPHPDQTKEFTESQLEQLFSNKENLATIRNATSASFYFLRPKEGYGFKNKLSEYERLTDPVPLDEGQRQALVKKLTDARKYGWVAARKGCLPSPGIALTLKTESSEMNVVFCFACNVLSFYGEEDKIGGQSFDMMRTTFVRILKSVYPDNELIQGLPRSGCGLSREKKRDTSQTKER